jgi:hypothetical protein
MKNGTYQSFVLANRIGEKIATTKKYREIRIFDF